MDGFLTLKAWSDDRVIIVRADSIRMIEDVPGCQKYVGEVLTEVPAAQVSLCDGSHFTVHGWAKDVIEELEK